jgi:hypothetical protein
MKNVSGAEMHGPIIELPVHRNFKEIVLCNVFKNET